MSECLRCGIIFAKIQACEAVRVAQEGSQASTLELKECPQSLLLERLRGLLFTVDPGVNPFHLAGRTLVFLGLVVWGWKFMTTPMETNYVGESFMHLVNLPFHEAGHLIFSPLGRFVQVLGGTLGQILMPCVCLGVFLIKNRDPFGASVALWWVAENFMDIAPYINDARALDLILLGGVTGKEVDGYHDWQHILGSLGWLQYDHVLAVASYRFGILLMILALFWGGSLLYCQIRHRHAL